MPRPLGRLIAETRRRRGFSQTRLAALLCAAAGTTTVTRHEVSRWERGERVPGAQWLAWLALVLDLPPALLVAAAPPPDRPLPADGVEQFCRLAERWLHQTAVSTTPPGPPSTAPHVAELRRMDDLVGGADLAPVAHRRWREAVTRLRRARGADRRRLLRPAAELAQLAGWTAADAGDGAGALRAYRAGLLLALEAGDTPLGGHLLGCASHLLGEVRPRAAWQLARVAAAGVRRSGSPGLRALLAHRAALAAARSGDGRTAGQGLLVAQRLGERLGTDPEPSWLYWLDPAELTAMTGRCLVVLDRPLRALPLLDVAGLSLLRRGQPRTVAVYAGWRARALLGIGEVEQACAVGGGAAIEAVRSGSVRAAEQTRELSARLAPRRQIRAVRDLSELIRQLTSYLPGSSPAGGVN
ncbi:helix-turn-helix domain-containing protein [Catellatospora sp. NPDC049609]|uniref:helix-turn-helix domain-containing protein n=1 Tax=Catellatospora sp. NPDC049609 TaxID=3155505 RepID=UPI0034425131